MARPKTPEEAKQEFLKKALQYKRLFNSSDGQDVLKDLEAEFHNRTSIVLGDPYATHAREGAREVILFIKEKMEIADNV